MAGLSILLGVLSLACVALGVLATPIPMLGALFSFAAPLLAIAGIIVGGLAMSRSQRAGPPVTPGEPVPVARAGKVGLPGVILSAVALLPALVTALTCGVCNALFSTGQIQTRRDFKFDIQRGLPPPAPPRDAPDGGREPPADPGAPPPVFPPPPLDRP
jgi:hypothetical protein